MSYIGVIGDVVCVMSVEDEASWEWRIGEDFFSRHVRWDEYCQSPDFSFGGDRWYLGLWPNIGIEERDPVSGSLKLRFYRWLKDGSLPRRVRCCVGIKGSAGVTEMGREGEFSDYDRIYDFKDFCHRSDLLQQRERLMPGGRLTITCHLRGPGAAAVGGVSTHLPLSNQGVPTIRTQSSDKRDAVAQTDCDLEAAVFSEEAQSSKKRDAGTQTDCDLEAAVFSEEAQSSEKRGGEKALEDFGKLLISGDVSDVTVKVGDEEFKVHKFVLSARSLVLAAMLKHNTEERASNTINIEDCEPEDFRQYLHYLYSGSVQSLTEQNALGLFRIADKYLADDLKQQCLEHIRNSLSVQTFCEAVKLALMHGESGLLEQAIDFATVNIRSIISSVEWQIFHRDYPTESNEILIKSLGPPS